MAADKIPNKPVTGPSAPAPASTKTSLPDKTGPGVGPAKEGTYIKTKEQGGSGLTQKVVEAGRETTPDPRFTRGWSAETEDYLKEQGWEPDGVDDEGEGLWRDPRGPRGGIVKKPVIDPRTKEVITHIDVYEPQLSHPPHQESKQLPTKDGGVETIKQWVHPPVQWSYPTREALRIARERESSGDVDNIDDVIARKELELEQLKAKKARREVPAA